LQFPLRHPSRPICQSRCQVTARAPAHGPYGLSGRAISQNPLQSRFPHKPIDQAPPAQPLLYHYYHHHTTTLFVCIIHLLSIIIDLLSTSCTHFTSLPTAATSASSPAAKRVSKGLTPITSAPILPPFGVYQGARLLEVNAIAQNRSCKIILGSSPALARNVLSTPNGTFTHAYKANSTHPFLNLLFSTSFTQFLSPKFNLLLSKPSTHRPSCSKH